MVIRDHNKNQDTTNNNGNKGHNNTGGNAGGNNNINPEISAFLGQYGIRQMGSASGRGGEDLENLFKATESKINELQETSNVDGYRVFRALKDKYGLNYSSVVLTFTLQGITTLHVMMLESTGETPESRVEYIGPERVEIMRPPASALDADYMDRVRAMVAGALFVNEETVNLADGVLVPRELVTSEPANLSEIVNNAINAVTTETILSSGKVRGKSIRELMSKHGSRFVVDTEFVTRDKPFTDQTGMPVRRDIRVTLSLRNQEAKAATINQWDSSTKLVTVYGYMDFEYRSPKVEANGMIGTRCFIPNFIITHVELYDYSMSPGFLILAMIQLLKLSEDQTWVQAYIHPQFTRKNETNFNEIGNLNIEGNTERKGRFGEAIDTTQADITPTDILDIINELVYPSMLISVDIPTAGPNTWFTSLFKYVSLNVPNAVARLNSGISDLTEGACTHIPHPMFFPTVNLIHGGYFRQKGEIVDIRNICSYLGVAGFVKATNQNQELLRKYTLTFSDPYTNPVIRAKNRLEYIREMSGGTEVVKQYIDRQVVSKDWLEATYQVLRNSGLVWHNGNTEMAYRDIYSIQGVDLLAASVSSDIRLTGRENHYASWNDNSNPYARNWYNGM